MMTLWRMALTRLLVKKKQVNIRRVLPLTRASAASAKGWPVRRKARMLNPCAPRTIDQRFVKARQICPS